MQTQSLPIQDIRPYDNNPRQNDQAVDAVAKSIEEFGFRQPIVVTEDHEIVVGHTRWKAALKLGIEEVPVHVARELTPEQVRAYRIADNKTHELADWDDELLAQELRELQKLDVDLGPIGFSTAELAQLFGGGTQTGQTDPDQIPEPPEQATTQRGDLWLLGEHRLLCGDAADTHDVDQLVDGKPVHLLNTDPPYNVRVEPRSGNAKAAGLSSFTDDAQSTATSERLRAKDRPLRNDFVSPEEYSRLLNQWFGQAARVLEPGRSFYIWGGYGNCANYPPALQQQGLYFSQALIWVKQHPVINRKDYMGNHEWCFYGWKEGAAHQFFGPPNAEDVWSIKKVCPHQMVHLTEKPVALAERAIQYSTQPGERVLDLFGGSGSTLIAAQQTGRQALLMEIDELYCDVIVQRWEAFTGQEAQRVSGTTTSMLS